MENCPKCGKELESYLCKKICPVHGVVKDCHDAW